MPVAESSERYPHDRPGPPFVPRFDTEGANRSPPVVILHLHNIPKGVSLRCGQLQYALERVLLGATTDTIKGTKRPVL